MRRLVAVIALCACKQDKPAPEPAPAAPKQEIKLFVDEFQVSSLPLAQLKLWPRVDTLVPPAARRLALWRGVTLTLAGTETAIAHPATAYPATVPALFPGEGGTPVFGMFDPVALAKHGAPVFSASGVREVHIALANGSGSGEHEQPAAAGDTVQRELTLTVEARSGEQTLDRTKLLTMQREPAPGSDGEGKGWKLSKVLALAGVKHYERVLLTDVKGTSVTLEKQDLDEKTAIPFVKLNRQGTLRFRVFRKHADGWTTGSDLRGLTRIEVLK
jgi:hypothetical protein